MSRDLMAFLKKVKNRFSVEKAILFGSRVRGDHFLDSDVDVMVISKDFKEMEMAERMAALSEFWSVPIYLEASCYTPEEFKKMKKQIGIVQQAVKEGKEIALRKINHRI
jgi:predicted nucleotidyltransferase